MVRNCRLLFFSFEHQNLYIIILESLPIHHQTCMTLMIISDYFDKVFVKYAVIFSFHRTVICLKRQKFRFLRIMCSSHFPLMSSLSSHHVSIHLSFLPSPLSRPDEEICRAGRETAVNVIVGYLKWPITDEANYLSQSAWVKPHASRKTRNLCRASIVRTRPPTSLSGFS